MLTEWQDFHIDVCVICFLLSVIVNKSHICLQVGTMWHIITVIVLLQDLLVIGNKYFDQLTIMKLMLGDYIVCMAYVHCMVSGNKQRLSRTVLCKLCKWQVLPVWHNMLTLYEKPLVITDFQ